MSRTNLHAALVGNEFGVVRPLQPLIVSPAAEMPAASPIATVPLVPAALPTTSDTHEDFTPTGNSPKPSQRLMDMLHRHSFLLYVVLLLLIGAVSVEVAGKYWSAHIISQRPQVGVRLSAQKEIAGLNVTIPAKDLQTRLQQVVNQPATLTVGGQTIPVGADTIRSWLHISTNAAETEDYVHISADTIAASLTKLADKFVVSPINAVTVSEDGVNRLVVGGRNGTSLSDPSTLKVQAQQIAKMVMGGKGMQFSTPLRTTPFQSVTPAAFGKLIDVNLATKQMYIFQNGQLIKNYGVSAGGPRTPTPQGEFHIYEKLPVQDMWGYGPGHAYYFQPHVYWVNYFDGGDAVHGVYWHPLSWFGAVNSSHGCVGVPDNEAQWIYNWAPIGTTVITHA